MLWASRSLSHWRRLCDVGVWVVISACLSLHSVTFCSGVAFGIHSDNSLIVERVAKARCLPPARLRYHTSSQI